MRRAVRSFPRSTGLFARALLSTGPLSTALLSTGLLLTMGLVVVGGLLLAACDGGGSPSAPSPVVRPPVVIIPPPRALEPGPATLMVIGPYFAIGDLGVCSPAVTGPREASIATRVILSRDGDDWVARMQPPLAGDLELRFRDELDGGASRGTVRGFAAAEPNVFLGGDLRVQFTAGDGPPATFVGIASRSGPSLFGQAEGDIRFVHADGTLSTTCPRATLSLASR